jgi:protein-S-isoprenylcysteine O-methyltransferase Ste14
MIIWVNLYNLPMAPEMNCEEIQKKAHKHREDLTGEHPFGDAGQVLLACLFAATWIADTFFFKYTNFLNGYIPLGARAPLAAFLLIVSGYLAKKGLAIVFKEKIEKPAVIRKSVFGIVRHPIYLSEILFYLGFLMLSLSLAAMAVWIVAIAFLHFIATYEEKLLLARFGEDYEKYLREVPMWLPRIRKG